MAIHHGGKVGRAGQKLASNKSNKTQKAKASQILNAHKKKAHSK